jgi:uncharacterized protein YbjT (DUF2867 family)
MNNNTRKALVFGATGNLGGAAARELLRRGWLVRAVTRNPRSEKALALADLGAEVVQADMDGQDSLETAFAGMERVFSVQNWVTSGVDGEVRQGKLVADVAKAAQVQHLVYGSAGTGEEGTGLAHFDSKLAVEAYMRDLGLPFTSVRPGPFMELMSSREFFPPLVAWGTMPRVLGWDTPLPWAAVHDLGTAIANILADPATWIGRDVEFFSDVRSLRACQALFKTATGRRPFGVPLPATLFKRMAEEEFVHMWQWLAKRIAERGTEEFSATVAASREVCPNLHSVESWLRMSRNGGDGT